MRTSSKRNPNGIQTDSERIPSETESVRKPGRVRVSSSRGSSYKKNKDRYGKWKPEDEGTPAFTKRKQSDLSWAKAHLPGEYPPYVVAAMDSVRISGEKTTASAVMARLRAEGRDAASRVAREKSKGIPQGDDAA
jgi:hypothetical protein